MSCFTEVQHGPYVGVENEHTVVFRAVVDAAIGKKLRTRTFHVFTYRAYNAMGLIGPECNGVCILDEDRKQVLCDEIDKADSGYFGVSEAAASTAEMLAAAPWSVFQKFVNQHPRSRYQI